LLLVPAGGDFKGLRSLPGVVMVWALFAPGFPEGAQGRRCESAATPSL